MLMPLIGPPVTWTSGSGAKFAHKSGRPSAIKLAAFVCVIGRKLKNNNGTTCLHTKHPMVSQIKEPKRVYVLQFRSKAPLTHRKLAQSRGLEMTSRVSGDPRSEIRDSMSLLRAGSRYVSSMKLKAKRRTNGKITTTRTTRFIMTQRDALRQLLVVESRVASSCSSSSGSR